VRGCEKSTVGNDIYPKILSNLLNLYGTFKPFRIYFISEEQWMTITNLLIKLTNRWNWTTNTEKQLM